MIRIVVADDHQLVRQGIVSLLDREKDIEVVGEAADGHETLNHVQQKNPDLVLIDIAMPLLNGMETVRRMHTLDVDTRAIILSMHADEGIVRQALKNGACGYLLKSSVVEELIIAIRSAVSGRVYLSPSIAQIVASKYGKENAVEEPSSSGDRLTTREREILQLIVEGHTNFAIGQLLNISTKTVEKHRASLMKKLEVDSIPDLMIVALKNRLVFLDE